MLTGHAAAEKADFPLITTGPWADFFPTVTDHAEMVGNTAVTAVRGGILT
jgi:hypothetical protein